MQIYLMFPSNNWTFKKIMFWGTTDMGIMTGYRLMYVKLPMCQGICSLSGDFDWYPMNDITDKLSHQYG